MVDGATVNFFQLLRGVRRSRIWELWKPFFYAPLVGLAWHWLGICFPKDPAVLASSVTAGSIVVGFLATCLILVLSADTAPMQRVRKTGYLKDLVTYIAHPMLASMFFVALNLSGYFLDTTNPLFGVLWAIVGATVVFTVWRLTTVLLSLIAN